LAGVSERKGLLILVPFGALFSSFMQACGDGNFTRCEVALWGKAGCNRSARGKEQSMHVHVGTDWRRWSGPR
jgi:hypothetical protein